MDALHLLIAAIFSAAWLPGISMGAPCPTNTLGAMWEVTTSSEFAASIAGSQTCSGPVGGVGEGRASYNLALGRAEVSASASGECNAEAHVRTHDVFTLIGPEGTGTVSFLARLDLYGFGLVTLREGTANGKTLDLGGLDSLSIGIGRAVGETFDLYLELDAFAAHGAGSFVYAQLSFSGLPPGHAVSSCQGFVSDTAVPAKEVSWGRLKTTFR